MLYLLPPKALKNFLKISAEVRDKISEIPPKIDEKKALEEAQNTLVKLLKCKNGGLPPVAIFQLLKLVERAFYIGEATFNDWLLINEVREVARFLEGKEYCAPIDDVDRWREILLQAVKSINSSRFRHELMEGSRSQGVAKALLDLKGKGFCYILTQKGFQLSDKEFSRLCTEIERKISKVGGERSANMLLDIMERRGRIHDGSFLFGRNVTSFGKKYEPGVPYHFILSLCLKNLDKKPTTDDPAKALTAMEELVKAMGAALDVEPYSAFEYINIPTQSVLYVLQERIVYDELFAIPQWQPIAAEFIMPKWLDLLDEEGCKFPIVSKEKWKILGERIFKFSRIQGFQQIGVPQLMTVQFSNEEMLDAVEALSQPGKETNAKFKTPLDTAERTSTYFPILGGKGEPYRLQPRSIISRSFCERIGAFMREQKIRKLDEKLGNAHEKLTKEVLEKFGSNVTFFNAEYRPKKGKQQECDVIVETSDRIYFIECKMKVLKGLSRSGSQLSILQDFNESFLKMMEQLTKHEAEILQNGEIEFVDEAHKGQRLELKGREVERVAISLYDHGSSQDRAFLTECFNALIGAKFDATDESARKTVERSNELIDAIAQNLNVIQDYSDYVGNDFVRPYMFGTWWLSIDQLYYICHQKGGLSEGLNSIRSMTNMGGDLFHLFKHNIR